MPQKRKWVHKTPRKMEAFGTSEFELDGNKYKIEIPNDKRVVTYQNNQEKYKLIFNKLKDDIKDDNEIEKDKNGNPWVHYEHYTFLLKNVFDELGIKWNKADEIWIKSPGGGNATPFIKVYPLKSVGIAKKGKNIDTLKTLVEESNKKVNQAEEEEARKVPAPSSSSSSKTYSLGYSTYFLRDKHDPKNLKKRYVIDNDRNQIYFSSDYLKAADPLDYRMVHTLTPIGYIKGDNIPGKNKKWGEKSPWEYIGDQIDVNYTDTRGNARGGLFIYSLRNGYEIELVQEEIDNFNNKEDEYYGRKVKAEESESEEEEMKVKMFIIHGKKYYIEDDDKVKLQEVYADDNGTLGDSVGIWWGDGTIRKDYDVVPIYPDGVSKLADRAEYKVFQIVLDKIKLNGIKYYIDKDGLLFTEKFESGGKWNEQKKTIINGEKEKSIENIIKYRRIESLNHMHVVYVNFYEILDCAGKTYYIDDYDEGDEMVFVSILGKPERLPLPLKSGYNLTEEMKGIGEYHPLKNEIEMNDGTIINCSVMSQSTIFSSTSTVPSTWSEHMSKTHNRPYWSNSTTKETTWNKPTGGNKRKTIKKKKNNRKSKRRTRSNT